MCPSIRRPRSHIEGETGGGIHLWPVLFLLAFWAHEVAPALFSGRIPTDFLSFYTAAAMFSQGDIYDPHTLRQAPQVTHLSQHIFPYLYPPPLAFYLQPLAHLPLFWAARVWTLLNGLALILLILLVYKLLDTRTPPSTRWIWTLALLYILPFANNIHMGQANIWVLLALTWAFYAWHRGAEGWGGVGVGIAAVLKLMPGVLLLYLLVERRWKAILGATVGAMAFSFPTFFGAGRAQWGHFIHFLGKGGYAQGVAGLFGPAAWPNFSLAGLWSRVLGETPAAARATWISVLLLLIVLLAAHGRSRGRKRQAFWWLAYLTWMIISAPYAYVHHVVYLYPAAVRVLAEGPTTSRWEHWGLPVAALTLASMDWPAYYRFLPLIPRWPSLLANLNLYALLVLFFWALYKGSRRVVLEPQGTGL
ncbi:MAG: DUF2029 domain-containing protein [Chloroflexi bacterium]|nr:DUF2029 domain-containing protein [Chloroflexota bacterium]